MMNASAATPMGRLIKKSHRHEKASVIQPPANGPAIEAMPKTPPRYPLYLPRSRGLMMSPIIVCESGMIVPIPKPWIARAPTSHQNPCAAPARIEPSIKMTSPAM